MNKLIAQAQAKAYIYNQNVIYYQLLKYKLNIYSKFQNDEVLMTKIVRFSEGLIKISKNIVLFKKLKLFAIGVIRYTV